MQTTISERIIFRLTRSASIASKQVKSYLKPTWSETINLIPYLTHDLFLILEKILPMDKDAENLRDSLAILMPYAVEIRYPDDWYLPTEEDALEAREAAAQVLKWLRKALPQIF